MTITTETGDVVHRINALVEQYARHTEREVQRGVETPYFAAFRLQTYTSGVLACASEITGDTRVGDATRQIADDACDRICSDWREKNRERYSNPPADIVSGRYAK